jgi:hypothetical protein
MITFLKIPSDVLEKIWRDIRVDNIGKEGKSKHYQLPPHIKVTREMMANNLRNRICN